MKQRVLELVEDNSHAGQKQLPISIRNIFVRIHKGNILRSYHLTLVQELKPVDYPKRLELYNCLREKPNVNLHFYDLSSRFVVMEIKTVELIYIIAITTQVSRHWVRRRAFSNHLFYKCLMWDIWKTNYWFPLFRNERKLVSEFHRKTIALSLENVNLGTRQNIWYLEEAASGFSWNCTRIP